MPSTTPRQQRFFGWLAHSNSPEATAKRESTGMTKEQVHDFSFKPSGGKALRKWKLNKEK